MPRKPKFRPAITRVKLNPEQAVLVCSCFDVGRRHPDIGYYLDPPICRDWYAGKMKSNRDIAFLELAVS